MKKDVVILLAEDDEGHAGLITRNLRRSGIVNDIQYFKDGEEILNFLFKRGDRPHREPNVSYVLLLDIRMPKCDGVEVLEKIKADPKLSKLPVSMITSTDDPLEIERCHSLGCNNYITKPIEYESFVSTMRQLGLFLSIVEIPLIDGDGAA